MKKLLFIIAVLLSFGVHAQTFTPIHNYQAPDGLDVVKFLGIPYGATPTLNGINRPSAHPLYYKTTDSSLYLYTGSQWIRVGGGNGNKDTVLVDEGLGVRFDSSGYQHIFAIHPDGYEGGIVTYAGTGFDFNVSPITLYLNNKIFQFPATTLTLSPPNSQPRYDIFGVDSLGAFVKSGDTAAVPVEPQVGIDSFALTKAFLISPGDTVPSGIDVITIYDETGDSPEFTASTSGTITTDLVNPDNPYHLSKAIYVNKYSNNSRLNFLSASQITIDDGQVITGYIYINSTISALNFRLYNGGTAVSNNIKITNGYGLNTVLLNQYQKFSIPLSAFTMSGTSFNTIRITNSGNDNSGAGGYYLDYLQFQTGINNVPSPTDYSSKQDSNLVRNDSLFWVAKGVEHFITKIGTCDTCISTVNISADSTLLYFIRVNGDTARIVDFYGGGGSYQLPYNGNSTDYLGGDTAYHALPDISTKLNISDTASMLSPYLRKNAIAEGTGISFAGTGTDADPIVISSSGSGVDSTAYHTVQVAQDSLWIICDLQGRCDTTVFNTSNIWAKNGNKIYYNTGNVGIGTTDPPSLLTLLKPTTKNTPDDSLGLALQTSTDATSDNPTNSLPLIFGSKAWVTSASASQDAKFKIYARGSNGTATGNLYIDFSGNGAAYTNAITIGQNGNLTTNNITAGTISGSAITGNTFTSTRNVNNGSTFTDNTTFIAPSSPTTYRSFYYNPTWTTATILGIDVRAFDNTIGNNVLNRTLGSTSIGTDSVIVGAKLSVTDSARAFLPPRMTKIQRDKIYSGFTGSITAGGSKTGPDVTSNIFLTGGSGTGCTARVTITGNTVTSVTILDYGTGYTAGDVLTNLTSGSGSMSTLTGFTWTISAITPPKAGSVIYQTDNTPGIRVFNGTNWMKFTETAD